MKYTVEEIAAAMGARVSGVVAGNIEYLLTDSRSLAFPESTLFFALVTPTGNGHKYIAQLYRRGVRAFVVEKLPQKGTLPEACFLQVDNSLDALQRLAGHHRSHCSGVVVGITGSNGKTVVKEWLAQVQAPLFPHVVRSPRSYNSQTGVPLSLWSLKNTTPLAIIEAGISRPGEMKRLERMVKPTVGILTHLGSAHRENFASLEEKCREKLTLFRDSRYLVTCLDNEQVIRCIESAGLQSRVWGWSRRDAAAPVCVEWIKQGEGASPHTDIGYAYKRSHYSFRLPFFDEASIENALHCLTTSLLLSELTGKGTPESFADTMETLEPVAMRLEVKQGVRDCTLINDAYNADLNSLNLALEFMARRPEAEGKRRALILSEMVGVGARELLAHVESLAERYALSRIILVGASFAGAPFPHYDTTDELLASGLLHTLQGEIVLLKGARRFNFETLDACLALRQHETTLSVNLAALADNLSHYRSCLSEGVKMVCMVKASAYGTGSIEVARTLQDRGVDYLAVAVADEGAELRRAGITTGIMVMNPEPAAFGTLFAYRLEPEVYSFALLDGLTRAAQREGVQDFPVHVKLDTGMARLGFSPEQDIPQLIEIFRQQTALKPRSIFSHFVGSDDDSFDNFTQKQFARFDAASQTFCNAFSHKILRHICNSAAIARFPAYHLDMVRLGLGLYGIDPYTQEVVNPVATLQTVILQVRQMEAGQSVGYSRRTVLTRPSRIAAIPIGYADGLNRHLGNRGGYCLVNGRRADYVGNICMDVCMVDVTDVDCREGDPVEIFGEHLPASLLASWLDTIPYEVLTAVSTRVQRVYYV